MEDSTGQSKKSAIVDSLSINLYAGGGRTSLKVVSGSAGEIAG